METKLSELATQALHSANAQGQIIIPCASACEIEAIFEELSELEKAGVLSRTLGKKLYRPFVLTGKGWELKQSLSNIGQVLSA